MTKGLRWRVLSLQVAMVVIFGVFSGILFWGASFSHSQVTDQLAAQKISFPAANDKSIAALPAADATAMRQYAGQNLVNGDQAKVYADNFIGVHLSEIGAGKTYSQLSAESMANPTDTKLAGEVATVFKGTTLRGMLLNAYGWWTVGNVVLVAAIAMLVATLVVLLTFAFEIELWTIKSRAKARASVRPAGAQI